MNNQKLLTSLLTFSEVASRGSFTHAAKQLGLSKSAVSQQVSRLEEEIGLQLLSRNTRGLALTAPGEKLHARCVLLQDQVDLVFRELSIAEQTPTGPFSVTFPHSLQRSVAIPAVSQLCREYPDLEPRLEATDKALDLIKNKLDAAIYVGDLKNSNYRALPIGTIRGVFCATPNYLEQHGRPTEIEELQQHRWIANPWQQSPLPLTYFEDKIESTALSVKLSPFCKVNTLPSAIEMALQDVGIILIPDVIGAPYIQAGKLVCILESYRGRVWPVHMIHPYEIDKPIHITRFHQLVKHFFEINKILT